MATYEDPQSPQRPRRRAANGAANNASYNTRDSYSRSSSMQNNGDPYYRDSFQRSQQQGGRASEHLSASRGASAQLDANGARSRRSSQLGDSAGRRSSQLGDGSSYGRGSRQLDHDASRYSRNSGAYTQGGSSRRSTQLSNNAGSAAGEAGAYSRNNSAYSSRAGHGGTRRRGVSGGGGGKLKFVLIGILAIVVVVAVLAAIYLVKLQANLNDGVTEEVKNVLVETDYANEPFYILLLGTDKDSVRESDEEFGDTWRSDSMILARIDPVNKKISMISLLRDTMVNIEGYGTQKLNAAYTLGGAALTVKTVSQMTGLPISHYAEVNFDGFQAMVDALGGIYVNVPIDMDDDDSWAHLSAGWQTLDGSQALAVCRDRHDYESIGAGDVMRAANQRMILSAIVEKALSSDIITLTNTVTTMSQYVTTDFKLTDIVGLAQVMQGISLSDDIYTASEPTTSEYIDGLWYEILDQTAWQKMLDRMNKGLSPAETSEIDASGTILSNAGSITLTETTKSLAEQGKLTGTAAVRNGTTTEGLATTAAATISKLGFTAEAGNASTSFTNTLVVYNTGGNEQYAAAIVDALGVGSVMANDGNYSTAADYLVILGSDYTPSTTDTSTNTSN